MRAKERPDRLFSAYAILHDARCVTCGAINATLQGGHFFGRTRQSIRWDTRNCFCQCAQCNATHENNTEPLRRVAIQRLGDEGLAALELDGNESLPQPDLDKIKAGLLTAIFALPRYRKLSESMKMKIMKTKFSNRELIAAIHGQSTT